MDQTIPLHSLPEGFVPCVTSSHIRAIKSGVCELADAAPGTIVLEVIFKGKDVDRRYHYEGVTKAEFEQMLVSPHPGQYLDKVVKPKCPCTRRDLTTGAPFAVPAA